MDVVLREEWGAPTSSGWDPEIADVNRIVVHHTATSVDMNNPANTVKSIYNYHFFRCSDNSGSYDPNNPNCDEPDELWLDIGYNYLIDPYGKIYEGRAGGNGVIGAHAIPNSGSIGISILGDYTNQLPTQAAIDSLVRLSAYLSKLNNFELGWKTSFFGHRDINATACPGNTFYPILNQLPALANQLLTENPNLASVSDQVQLLINDREYLKEGDLAQVIVNTKGLTAGIQNKLLTASRGVEEVYNLGDAIEYKVDESRLDQFLTETRLAVPDSQAQPNYIYRLDTWDNSNPDRSIPDDFDSATHWNLEKVNAPEGWKNMGGCNGDDLCGGSPSVTVAVIDTGAAYENYDYDAGTNYSLYNAAGYWIDIPASTTRTGASAPYEGYERNYRRVPELDNSQFEHPYDIVQDYFCELRDDDPTVPNCNSYEIQKIDHANDDYGHGTFVTSIIAAMTGNSDASSEVVGIAHNVKVMPIKAFFPNDITMCQDYNGAYDPTCSDPDYDFRAVSNSYLIAASVNYAADFGADIINMSLSGPGDDPFLTNAIQEAQDRNVLVVAASGNNGSDVGNYFPANIDGVVTVGATTGTDARASYSNYGAELDIVAPVGNSGSGVASIRYSCLTKDDCSDETDGTLFQTFSSQSSPIVGIGTSFAAPQVSALAAIMRSKYSFPLDEADTANTGQNLMKTYLYNFAQDIGTPGWDSQTGYGLMDIEAVLDGMDPPTLNILTPGSIDVVDTVYSAITWEDVGFQSFVNFYWDTDDSGFDGNLINGCKGIDGDDDTDDSCNFNTSTLQDGDYYIYGCIEDAINTEVCTYSSGIIRVQHDFKSDAGKFIATTDFQTVEFSSDFDVAPIVVAEVSSEVGTDRVFINIKNVTSSGFEVQIRENEPIGYDGFHTPQTISWYAVQSASSDIQIGNISVNENWTTVNFYNEFPTIPTILTTKQTFNGTDLSYTDIRNVTVSSFDLKIEEPYPYDGNHVFEDVGWIALVQYPGGENGIVQGNHEWASVNFSTPFPEPPVLIAGITSEYGIDPAQVDIRNVNKEGFEFRVEEDPLIQDIFHAYEDISWLSVPYNALEVQKGKTIISDDWRNYQFSTEFSSVPKLLFNITSEYGSDTVSPDIRLVDSIHFNARLEEDVFAYWDNFHSDEELSWYSFTSPPIGTDGGIVSINHEWTTVNFSETFSGTPTVFADINSEVGPDTIDIDIRNISSNSFQIRIEEDLGAGWDGYHSSESIAWLAFETPPIGQSGIISVNEDWLHVDFPTPFSSIPNIICDIQTENGTQTVQGDIKNVSTSGFDVRLEEEYHIYDRIHAFEDIAWWAFE